MPDYGYEHEEGLDDDERRRRAEAYRRLANPESVEARRAEAQRLAPGKTKPIKNKDNSGLRAEERRIDMPAWQLIGGSPLAPATDDPEAYSRGVRTATETLALGSLETATVRPAELAAEFYAPSSAHWFVPEGDTPEERQLAHYRHQRLVGMRESVRRPIAEYLQRREDEQPVLYNAGRAIPLLATIPVTGGVSGAGRIALGAAESGLLAAGDAPTVQDIPEHVLPSMAVGGAVEGGFGLLGAPGRLGVRALRGGVSRAPARRAYREGAELAQELGEEFVDRPAQSATRPLSGTPETGVDEAIQEAIAEGSRRRPVGRSRVSGTDDTMRASQAGGEASEATAAASPGASGRRQSQAEQRAAREAEWMRFTGEELEGSGWRAVEGGWQDPNIGRRYVGAESPAEQMARIRRGVSGTPEEQAAAFRRGEAGPPVADDTFERTWQPRPIGEEAAAVRRSMEPLEHTPPIAPKLISEGDELAQMIERGTDPGLRQRLTQGAGRIATRAAVGAGLGAAGSPNDPIRGAAQGAAVLGGSGLAGAVAPHATRWALAGITGHTLARRSAQMAGMKAALDQAGGIGAVSRAFQRYPDRAAEFLGERTVRALETAAQRGPWAAIVTHHTLSQSDPEYRRKTQILERVERGRDIGTLENDEAVDRFLEGQSEPSESSGLSDEELNSFIDNL